VKPPAPPDARAPAARRFINRIDGIMSRLRLAVRGPAL